MLVGALHHADFVSRAVRLLPGAALFLYSNGLTEARTSQGARFGESGLTAHLVPTSSRHHPVGLNAQWADGELTGICPEHALAVARHDGDVRAVEGELGERVERHGSRAEQPLSPDAREHFVPQWAAVQEQFAPSPQHADTEEPVDPTRPCPPFRPRRSVLTYSPQPSPRRPHGPHRLDGVGLRRHEYRLSAERVPRLPSACPSARSQCVPREGATRRFPA